jgi:hypothetical protein
VTVKELIARLQEMPQDIPITVMRSGFPRDIYKVEVEPCTRYSDHWAVSYYPEVEDKPVTLIAIVRG